MDNNIGKIDVFNTLYYETRSITVMNKILECKNIDLSDIFENIDIFNNTKVQLLLSNNDNIYLLKNSYNFNGETILHYITYSYIKYKYSTYYDKFKYLIEHINIDKINLYGYSILYGVCKYHNIDYDIVKFLLEHGADPNLNIDNKVNLNPFISVCIKFYNIVLYNADKIELFLNIINVMIQHGADIYQKIIVKRVIGISTEIDSFLPYITQNEEIIIIDLFNEIDPKYKNIVLKFYHDHIFNKRLALLSMIEGCDKNYRLPLIFENEDYIKELCTFI